MRGVSALKGTVLAALAGLALAACGGEQAEAPDQTEVSIAVSDPATDEVVDISLIDTGRDIAERNCASCHSIERSGESPLPEAPPLRYALVDFDIEALATDFREHIQVGNDVMPEFDFNPLQTDALMAYLLSLEGAATEN